MASRRVAVVDMGTNTLKYSISEVEEDGTQQIIHAHADTVRIGAGIATTGRIDPQRIARALESLRFFEQVARVYQCEALLGVATAALRMASNGGELLDAIAESTAWRVRVISGDAEAQLAFAGVRHLLPPSGLACILDIGGGSTEAIVARDRILAAFESLGIGSGTLTDASFTADPPGLDAVRHAVATARETIDASLVLESARDANLVLTGGNGQFLNRLAKWSSFDIPFTTERFPDLLTRVATTPGVELARYLEIVPERARMLPAGGAIAQAVIDRIAPTSLRAVPSGIAIGVVAEWAAGHPAATS